MAPTCCASASLRPHYPSIAHVYAFLAGSAIRVGEGPRNPAEFIVSLLSPQKRVQALVIVPEAVAFNLQTAIGFS